MIIKWNRKIPLVFEDMEWIYLILDLYTSVIETKKQPFPQLDLLEVHERSLGRKTNYLVIALKP